MLFTNTGYTLSSAHVSHTLKLTPCYELVTLNVLCTY